MSYDMTRPRRRPVSYAAEMPTMGVASPPMLPPLPAPRPMPQPTEVYGGAGEDMGFAGWTGGLPPPSRQSFTPQPLPSFPAQDDRQMRRQGEGALIAAALGAIFGGAQGGAAAGQGYLAGAQQGQMMSRQNAMDQWRADSARVQEANDQGFRQQALQREDQRMAAMDADREEGRRLAREAAAQRVREFDFRVQQEHLDEVRRQVEEAVARGDRERAQNLAAQKDATAALLAQRKAYQEVAAAPIDPNISPAQRRAAAEAVQAIDQRLAAMGFQAQMEPIPGAMLDLPQIDPVTKQKMEADAAKAKAAEKQRAEQNAYRRQRDAKTDQFRSAGLDISRGNLSLAQRREARAAASGEGGLPKPMTPAQRMTQERLIRTDISALDKSIAEVRQEIAGFDMVMNKRGAKPEQVNAYKAMRQASEQRLKLLSAQREQKRQMLVRGGAR